MIFGIAMFAEAVRNPRLYSRAKFPFRRWIWLDGDILPWFRIFFLFLSHEKLVVASGTLVASKDLVVLHEAPAIAYEDMADIIPCSNPHCCMSGTLNQNLGPYPHPLSFRKV